MLIAVFLLHLLRERLSLRILIVMCREVNSVILITFIQAFI